MKTIDGRKAEVTDSMERYDSYVDFSVKLGYPDAACDWRKGVDTRKKPNNGDIVTLLVSAPHIERPYEGTLWIVESSNGERHIIGEKGLRILDEKVAVLRDELGLDREYREVKRNAKVGEKVRVFGHTLPELDGIHVVRETRSSGHIHWAGGGRLPGGYVVLEPTDIVHVNGERFRMVDRKANVGERVVVTKTGDDYSRHYQLGEHGVVTGERGWVYEDIHVDFGDKTKYIGPSASNSEYHVLEPLSPAQQTSTVEQPDAAEQERKYSEQQTQIDGLVETVANLARRLSEAETQLRVASEDIVLIEDGVSEELRKLTDRVAELEQGQVPTTKACEPVVSKTSARDEIIEKAKADVAELLAKNYADQYIWFVDNDGYIRSHKVEFVVNRTKRTVVALIHRVDEPLIDAKGIAKCAPNDCFNVHIGMAIAIRRALVLDIPVEYVSAPQPTEVCVGDIAEARTDRGVTVFITEITGRNYKYDGAGYGLAFNHTHDSGWVGEDQLFVIDDTRDGRYGEVYSV